MDELGHTVQSHLAPIHSKRAHTHAQILHQVTYARVSRPHPFACTASLFVISAREQCTDRSLAHFGTTRTHCPHGPRAPRQLRPGRSPPALQVLSLLPLVDTLRLRNHTMPSACAYMHHRRPCISLIAFLVTHVHQRGGKFLQDEGSGRRR